MAISKIPSNQFIVLGEGGFDKQSTGYLKLPQVVSSNSQKIPVRSGEVFYRLWSQANKRKGQFYFYNSTPEILNAIYNHPKTNFTYPSYDTTEALLSVFSEVPNRPKTTNWESNKNDHLQIRQIIKEIAGHHFNKISDLTKISHYTIRHT